MKKTSISLLLMSVLVFSLTGCGEKKVENVQDGGVVSTEEDKKESKDTVVLKSFDDYEKYVDKNIEEYKKLYEKHGISYKSSSDNSVIMNTETTYSKFGIEYENKSSVFVKLDQNSKKANVVNSFYLTSSINDKYLEDDENIRLAFDFLKVKDDSYELGAFIEELNNALDSITSERGHQVIRFDDNIAIVIEKHISEVRLFIGTNTEAKVEYPELKPMEFDTYEEYKEFVGKTNGEISDEDALLDGSYGMARDTIYNEDGTDSGTYEYGIKNHFDIDSQLDFKIELMMDYRGDINKPENLSFVIEKMCAFLREKFDLVYDEKEIEKFCLSEEEHMESDSFFYLRDSDVRTNIREKITGDYSSQPFPGVEIMVSSEEEYRIVINLTIPAIVEGRTAK